MKETKELDDAWKNVDRIKNKMFKTLDDILRAEKRVTCARMSDDPDAIEAELVKLRTAKKSLLLETFFFRDADSEVMDLEDRLEYEEQDQDQEQDQEHEQDQDQEHEQDQEQLQNTSGLFK